MLISQFTGRLAEVNRSDDEQEEEEEEEEEESLPQVPTHHEAQQALQTQLKHQLYQPGTQHHEVRLLQRIKRNWPLTA